MIVAEAKLPAPISPNRGLSVAGGRPLRAARCSLLAARCRSLPVPEHDPDRLLLLGRVAGEQLVGLLGALEREAVGDEGIRVDLAGGHQLEERLDVAALGPAHVAGRVVVAVELVGGVVAAWSVGARQPQVELAIVVGSAREVELDVADDHDRRPIGGQRGGEADRVVGPRGRGADEHGVGAAGPARGGVDLASQGRFGAGLGGEVAEAAGEVDAEHRAARGEGDPGRELADQPETDHGDARADLDVGAAEPVHRDRAERGEGGVLEGDAVRDRRAEQPRHDVDLGVVGGAAARDREPVSGADPADARADLDGDAGGAVAERSELLEALANELDRRAHPLEAGALDHLAGLVGPGARLRDEALAGDVERRALGPGGDERRLDADRDGAGRQGGIGNLDELEASIAQAPGDLPHRSSPAAVAPVVTGSRIWTGAGLAGSPTCAAARSGSARRRRGPG